jgi:urea transporter
MSEVISGTINTVLAGIGQVFFMGSPLVGILFIFGLWTNSWKAAAFAIIGSISGGIVGFVLGVPAGTVTYGIYGFNSVLTAIALGDTFLEKGKTAYVMATLAAFITGFATAALISITSQFPISPNGVERLPVQTSAFVVTTFIFLFAVSKFPGMKFASAGAAPKQRGAMIRDSSKEGPIKASEFTPGGFVKLIFTGIAQVMFQENWKTGVLFFIGLTLATVPLTPFAFGPQYPIYFAGVTAFIASLVGTLTAIAFKADRTSILMGLYGFNAVLTALAVMGVFLGFFWPLQGFPGSPFNFFVMLFAVAFSSVMTAAIGAVTSNWKVPTLTAPFVLTAWFIELSAHIFPNISSYSGLAFILPHLPTIGTAVQQLLTIL